MEFFDILKNTFYPKRAFPGEELKGVLWGINRFISMDMQFLPIVALVSKYFSTLKPEEYYTLLMSLLPKNQRRIRYVKKPKGREVDEFIENALMTLYLCKRNEVPEILDALAASGVTKKDIEMFFGKQPSVSFRKSENVRKAHRGLMSI